MRRTFKHEQAYKQQFHNIYNRDTTGPISYRDYNRNTQLPGLQPGFTGNYSYASWDKRHIHPIQLLVLIYSNYSETS